MFQMGKTSKRSREHLETSGLSSPYITLGEKRKRNCGRRMSGADAVLAVLGGQQKQNKSSGGNLGRKLRRLKKNGGGVASASRATASPPKGHAKIVARWSVSGVLTAAVCTQLPQL